jgi:hypothetical protein
LCLRNAGRDQAANKERMRSLSTQPLLLLLLPIQHQRNIRLIRLSLRLQTLLQLGLLRLVQLNSMFDDVLDVC